MAKKTHEWWTYCHRIIYYDDSSTVDARRVLLASNDGDTFAIVDSSIPLAVDLKSNILFVVQIVWNILFISYNQTEGTDYPENSIIYFFVKIIVDPGCKVILIDVPLISKFLQFTDQSDA